MDEDVELRCSEYVAASARNRIKIAADAIYYDILFHVDELENKLNAAVSLRTNWIVIAATCEACGREVNAMVFDHEPSVEEVNSNFSCGYCARFTLFKNIVGNRLVKVKEF
jgi:hypothetical protein